MSVEGYGQMNMSSNEVLTKIQEELEASLNQYIDHEIKDIKKEDVIKMLTNSYKNLLEHFYGQECSVDVIPTEDDNVFNVSIGFPFIKIELNLDEGVEGK